ncbi:hypothetical protein [Pseudonocardia sp. NPDC049154]|uniref:hypothetical protein n=1 Tax=Pseudonocardia sp. NPDC049154 TaxID=3155501 RepID=UPI0033F3E5DB
MPPTIAEPDLVLLRPATGVSAEARSLLDRAAAVDTEMGFGPPRSALRAEPGPTTVIEVDTCLHRHDVVHPDDYVSAAVLVVREVRPGVGIVGFVVDPDRRSIGVATAVVERLGTNPSGWVGTELRTLWAVAHGCHPAAERLARRVGLRNPSARSHLVLPAGEELPSWASPTGTRVLHPDDGVASPPFDDLGEEDPSTVLLAVDSGLARVRPAGRDGVAEIRGVASERKASAGEVVVAAVAWLKDRGATMVEALVDADDEALLEAFRSLHFEHDRTDLLFALR